MPKTKIIFIVLGAVIAIFMLTNIQTFLAQKRAESDRDKFKQENEGLNKKIEDLMRDTKTLDQKIKTLNKDLSNAAAEKSNLESKLNLANKEKDDLREQVKKMAAAVPAEETKKVAAPAPQAGDSYWAGILRAKTDLEMQLISVRSDLRNMQINNEQMQREKASLELEIKNLTRQSQDMKQQFDYNQKVVDSLSQELVREKNNKMEIETSAKTVKNENAVLRRQLRSLSERKIDMERKVADLQAKNANLEAGYVKIETMLKDKLMQIGDMSRQLESGAEPGGEQVRISSESVELPPIVVRPSHDSGPAVALAAAQKGEVLLVNKENNFVIVNLGDEAGLKIGDSLQIYRDEKPVAGVEVIQVRKNFSACDIKREESPIRIGDRVK